MEVTPMQSDLDPVCVPRRLRAAPDHARVARRLSAGRLLRVRRSSINAQSPSL
jgi:hypothetical protein